MRLAPKKRPRQTPPPVVLGVLALELIVASSLLAAGVPLPSLLVYGGPLIGFTLALLSPTVQELGRRQPKLQIRIEGKDEMPARAGDRPWPVDVDRIMANEVTDARQTAERHHPVLSNYMRLATPFAIHPTEADHQQAKEDFEEDVRRFKDQLRVWLTDYRTAAGAYANTFDVIVRLQNALSGAHAEAVTVILEPSEGLAVADTHPSLALPPDRPNYEPPRPKKPAYDLLHPTSIAPAIRNVAQRAVKLTPRTFSKPAWKITEDGRRLEASPGEVHPGRCVDVGDPILLRANGPGRHCIRWTIYSKSARKEVSGAVMLEIPPDPDHRPAFGRLNGITSYPDVPLVDGEGEIAKPVRATDPPPRPVPTDGDEDPLESLRHTRELLEWRLLGLDPADDGPEESLEGLAEPSPLAD
jgi:hypothetical protein